jgi:hypothetical protein
MNTDKEFVPYQPSLDMKSIGFDEPCFGVYATKDGYVRKSGYDENGDAPTFSQCFRWFREKYGIEGVTQRAEDFMWYKWTIYQYNENGKKYVFDWCEYETYEKAELECLKKLIEIVKNK